MKDLYKKIPQVAKLLEDKDVSDVASLFYNNEVKEEIEIVLTNLRKEIKEGAITGLDYDFVVKKIVKRLLNKHKYSLRRVINGTGTILHTNLGRAVLSENAVTHVTDILKGYSNLEYNLKTGSRGSRYAHINEKVAKLIGAEDVLIVNNNAAAVMLTMQAFAFQKEVVVSRGELVEIGGSFRVPEIIKASGAIMHEVGTTNRTHLKDYKRAINDNTAVLLKVHPSNYKIEGFTKEVSASELKELGIMVIEDLGSGLLVNLEEYGLRERLIQDAVQEVDVVTFSGDKLLGGPQVGVIAGKKEYIEILRNHPMTRALRVCKMTIATLEAVFRDALQVTNPTMSMIQATILDLTLKAEEFREGIEGFDLKVINCDSTIGGGSFPTSKLPSVGVSISHKELSLKEIERKLRTNHIPIVSRMHNDQLILDMRTLLNDDIKIIKDCLNA